mmetsp:Transcript_47038/g.117300  ORF Transcript_47038/g.117300 Transcript_47038/m.117300 type:complete len:222 (+) Transcript_47038:624-1289(+)
MVVGQRRHNHNHTSSRGAFLSHPRRAIRSHSHGHEHGQQWAVQGVVGHPVPAGLRLPRHGPGLPCRGAGQGGHEPRPSPRRHPLAREQRRPTRPAAAAPRLLQHGHQWRREGLPTTRQGQVHAGGAPGDPCRRGGGGGHPAGGGCRGPRGARASGGARGEGKPPHRQPGLRAVGQVERRRPRDNQHGGRRRQREGEAADHGNAPVRDGVARGQAHVRPGVL